MDLKRSLIGVVPDRYLVAARYWWRRATARLEKEVWLFQRLVRPGSTVIDVGGNVGMYAYALAARAGDVVVFEPLPECAAVIRAAHLPNVVVHEVALSERAGVAMLHVPLIGGTRETSRASFSPPGGQFDARPVPMRRLDDFELLDVSAMKIDVEGHELQVIRGAEQTLAREKPVLLVEIEQRHLQGPVDDVFHAILGFGYVGFFLDPSERLRPLDHFCVSSYQDEDIGARFERSYVNNFFFLHQADERHLTLQAAALLGWRPREIARSLHPSL